MRDAGVPVVDPHRGHGAPRRTLPGEAEVLNLVVGHLSGELPVMRAMGENIHRYATGLFSSGMTAHPVGDDEDVVGDEEGIFLGVATAEVLDDE